MYKKLDCTCGHGYDCHARYVEYEPCGRQGEKRSATYCFCTCIKYDPAGHNPELENILCPQCSLTRMEKKGDIYYCLACNFILFERQVKEMVG